MQENALSQRREDRKGRIRTGVPRGGHQLWSLRSAPTGPSQLSVLLGDLRVLSEPATAGERARGIDRTHTKLLVRTVVPPAVQHVVIRRLDHQRQNSPDQGKTAERLGGRRHPEQKLSRAVLGRPH